MKERNGFVSNSSSSSFIIGLNHKKYDLKGLMLELYPDLEGVHYEYSDDGDIDAMAATRAILSQIVDEKPIKTKKIVEAIGNGYISEIYNKLEKSEKTDAYTKYEQDFRYRTGKSIYNCQESHPKEHKEFMDLQQEYWKRRDEERTKLATEYWDKIKHTFEGKHVFITSHSDNDGSFGGALEHGDTYRNIPHITISQH